MEQPKKTRPLTPKEAAFCIHYTTNGYNATQAAISAGYSIKTANRIGSQNLSKLVIKVEIERLKQDEDARMNALGITKEAIMKLHYEFATCSIAELHNTWIERKDFESLTDKQKRCIEEIDTKVEYKVFEESGRKGKRKIEYVKIKLVSRQASMKELANLRGWNAPVKQDIKQTIIQETPLTPEQIQKAIDKL